MSAQYNPKTLAKTLSTISFREPDEHGLFWDVDGTMPWREFYWVLQEDPSLRFVREMHIREIGYLGLELPFVLDGNVLRLKPHVKRTEYPAAESVPERLYFTCRPKQFAFVKENGIVASARPHVPLCEDKDLALRIGLRRDAEPVLLEVFAAAAASEGQVFLRAGSELYLVESVPARHILFPLLRADRQPALEARRKPDAKPPQPTFPSAAGSFLVEERHLGRPSDVANTDKKGKQRGKKKTDWKRDSRNERHKRSL